MIKHLESPWEGPKMHFSHQTQHNNNVSNLETVVFLIETLFSHIFFSQKLNWEKGD
jgi:hypothetical protein